MGVASTAFGYEGSVVVHRPPATRQPRSSACAEPRSCPSRWSRTPPCCLLPIRSPKVSRTSSGAVPYAWRPPDLVGGRGRDPVDRGGEVGADPCAGKNRRSRVDVVPSTAPAIRWPPDQRDNVGRTPGSHRFRRRSRPCPVRAARRARRRATTRARTDRTVTLAEGVHETREARTPFHGGRTPRGCEQHTAEGAIPGEGRTLLRPR